jgi:hypothetical protein
MLVPFYQTARRHILEESILHIDAVNGREDIGYFVF